MKGFGRVMSMLLAGCCLAGAASAFASELRQEQFTTSPVVADGVIYVASSAEIAHRGHLRAIDIFGTFPVTLWDAVDKMPLAGSSAEQPQTVSIDNQSRYIITNLAERFVPLEANQSEALMPKMGVSSIPEAKMLLHAVRGRRGGSVQQPAGTREDPFRLWGISRSSPLLFDRRPAAESRDRILYAGAEDGMLHAFFVSGWDDDLQSYRVDEPDGGIELWAYLPGSMLPYVKAQPFGDVTGDLAVHLDGSPLARELFVDLEGEGRRRWRTLLAATGTILASRRSCLFLLDVTDPYQPELVWEQLLPGTMVGRSRGVNSGRCFNSTAECLYLATDFAPEAGLAGVHALAISLETGQLLWQFTAPYGVHGMVAEATPAVPALMDHDGNGKPDTLVFGDLIGQLWALDLKDGRPYGGAPVFMAPGSAAEPIGASVAVSGRRVIFGTGGVEGTSDQYRYSLSAVEIRPDGGRLLWSYPLEEGEKVWEAPTLDAQGNILFATARDYQSISGVEAQETSGRIIALKNSGEEAAARGATAGTVGRVVAAPGVVISVALTGEVNQFGTASRLSGPGAEVGSVKVLSWRQR